MDGFLNPNDLLIFSLVDLTPELKEFTPSGPQFSSYVGVRLPFTSSSGSFD
jgi:hypothetical protein